jgi:nucleoside-diphosphate-sugar epimerase
MSRAGSDLAQREFGWQASTSIDESIRAYAQWLAYDAEESQT